jgi:putative transposase
MLSGYIMTIKPMAIVLTMLAGWINRHQQEAINYLTEENRIIKEKYLTETGKKRIILNDKQRRKLAVLAKKVGRKKLFDISNIFSPDTLMDWYRKLVAAKYDGSKKRRKPGRPRIPDDVRQTIIDIARNHKHLGYRMLYGYLKYLGIKVSIASIRRILQEEGIEPAPDRAEKTSWNDFIKMHWNSLSAADFFTKEVFTKNGLVRYMVLVVIHYNTRKVEVAGIVPQADGEWMKQAARNLTDPFDGFLKDKKYVIIDKDSVYTKQVRQIFRDGGVRCIRTTPACPNMSPYIERFIRSIKHECLNKMIILGEKHLRHCVETYCEFYNTSRPHAGLDYNMIAPMPPPEDGRIVCKEWLGGVMKSWHRAA